MDVWITQPLLPDIYNAVALKEGGAPLHIGDTFTLVFDIDLDTDIFHRYYNIETLNSNTIHVALESGSSSQDIAITPVSFENKELKFVLDEATFGNSVGYYLRATTIAFKYLNTTAISYGTYATTNVNHQLVGPDLAMLFQNVIIRRE